MSDTSQGHGRRQASDGRWYPPEAHPNYRAQPFQSSALPQTVATAEESELMAVAEAPPSTATAAMLPTTLSRGDAVRFLQRATFGPSVAEADRLRVIGVNAWLDEQFAMDVAETNLSRRQRWPEAAPQSPNGGALDDVLWEGFLSDPAQLRKRVAFALSQILVAGFHERTVTTCAYADTLETHCFGTFRNLLEHASMSASMGRLLTYNNNRRATPAGVTPDENFAREVMQLFTIGLWQLNQDGSRVTVGGEDVPTYEQEDVIGLARVFTGFTTDGDTNPMRPHPTSMAAWYESGEKRFLGATIPAGTPILASLSQAFDVLAGHRNVAPFISKQLIQRLVTSNPSLTYVARVSAVFNNDGAGVRGNLAAVVRAILTDPEAWPTSPPASFGKLREPVLRFSTVLRALNVTATHPSGSSRAPWPWTVGDTSNPATSLGQRPYASPSVFNFYRPGYVPPATPLADANLVAPEFQIHDESSAIGWLNYLMAFLWFPPIGYVDARGTTRQLRLQRDDLLAMSSNPAGLVAELAARLCPHPLPASLVNAVTTAVARVTHSTDSTQRSRRVIVATTLLVASSSFLYER